MPIKTDACNGTLLGTHIPGVADLPVQRKDYGDGPITYSFWRPSWRQRLVLLLPFIPIRLGVYGATHAPVRVDLGDSAP